MNNQDTSLGSSRESADIVIVGNGIAGLTAAVEARRLAPEKRIVIITEQSHPTINTPALKQFAINKVTREQLLAYPAGTERAQHIPVINARVEAIRAQGKYVCLNGGRAFGYNSLLLATGSIPVGLPPSLPGRDFDGVLTLHNLHDYLDLRRRLPEVKQAVVIGGGIHAIETVRCLSHWGISVSWLIRGDTFLPHILDRPASNMVLERIARTGVHVYTETELVGIVGRVGTVVAVVTNSHQMLPCQLVVACTGVTPQTMLADHCDLPLRHNSGILVDDSLSTSVPHIYVAGDAAALKDPQTGTYAPRAQWYAAVLQGRIAAASMTGHPEAITPFGVPWHATHLGGLSLLTIGNPLSWLDSAATLTDSSKGTYRRLSVCDDRLVGYLSIGPTHPDGLAIKRLIDEGQPVRDITKALLKGEFDARQHFSRQHTHAAHTMAITGKLTTPNAIPSLHSAQASSSPDLIPSESEASLATTYTPRRTDSLDVGARFIAPVHRAIARVIPLEHEDEDISPFTGNLPTPTTESLAVPAKTIIESTLVSLPARTSRRNSRGLWSFSDKLPAVTRSSSTEPDPASHRLPDRSEQPRLLPNDRPHQKQRPSQKLLSYISKSNNEGDC